MKKKGDSIECTDGQTFLMQDEILSPTFEDLIILWSLEKISPHLPKLVGTTFSENFKDANITLQNIKDEIFNNIPYLLSQIDVDDQHETTTLCVFSEEKEEKDSGDADMTQFEIIKNDIGDLSTDPIITLQTLSNDQHQILKTDDDVMLQEKNESVDEVFSNLSCHIKENISSTTCLFECSVCFKTYNTRKKLLDHHRVHREKKMEVSECTICSKSFPSRKALTDHNRRQHKTEFTCPDCGLVFPTEKRMEIHLLSHSGYICQECNKEHETYKELYHHLQSHKEKMKCPQCDKTFRKKISLTKHIATHSTPKQSAKQKTKILNDVASLPARTGFVEILPKVVKCDKCGKEFGCSGELDVHKATQCTFNSSLFGRKETDKIELMKTNNMDMNIIPSSSLMNNQGCNNDGMIIIQNGETVLRVLPNFVPASATNMQVNSSPIKIVYGNTNVENPSNTVIEQTVYACNKCDKTYSRPADLSYHMLMHGLGKIYPCVHCEKKFVIEKQLWSHKKEMHGDEHICLECGISFKTKDHLTNHMKNHCLWVCELCGKNFAKKTLFDQHVRKHMSQNKLNGRSRRTVICNTCSRTFYSEEHLRTHVCKHHECDVCHQKFLKYKNLKYHKMIHAGYEMFSCDQCEALCQNRRRLNEHKRNTHNATRKYSCDICPKAFLNSKGLESHKLIHSGEKPFKCDTCGATFRQKGALVTHKRLHTNELPYKCAGCQQMFRTLGLLKQHREKEMCGFTKEDFFTNDEA